MSSWMSGFLQSYSSSSIQRHHHLDQRSVEDPEFTQQFAVLVQPLIREDQLHVCSHPLCRQTSQSLKNTDTCTLKCIRKCLKPALPGSFSAIFCFSCSTVISCSCFSSWHRSTVIFWPSKVFTITWITIVSVPPVALSASSKVKQRDRLNFKRKMTSQRAVLVSVYYILNKQKNTIRIK